MISGWWSHSATLSETLPRMPQLSIASIMRQKPARLP